MPSRCALAALSGQCSQAALHLGRRALFQTAVRLSHENPLSKGLPRTGTPPSLSSRRGPPSPRRIPSVSKVLAIASAKGGVGKSTVAANLALALARAGLNAGILDVDVHGPSIPTLFDLTGPPRLSEDNQLLPLTNYGVRTMSLGYLVPEDQPLAWRGLLVQRALQQLLHEVQWGGLDVLVLDMPPGTGDVALTVAQQVVLDGAVLVGTSSKLALKDTVRGEVLFRKMSVPVLGTVRNMAGFVCPGCGEATGVFGEKAEDKAEGETEVLVDIPLDASICSSGDEGKPCVVGLPESPGAKTFARLAGIVTEKMGLGRK